MLLFAFNWMYGDRSGWNVVMPPAAAEEPVCWPVSRAHSLTAAVNEWALETGQQTGATVNYPNDLTPYIQLNSNSSIPPCPAGGTYTVGEVGNLPQVTCSLSTLTQEPHKAP